MAAHATLVVAGRVDETIDREKVEKLLLVGLVNSLEEDAPALDAQFGHLSSAFPTPTANGEFGLCVSNASTTSAVTNHLIRVQFNPTAEQFRTALREAFAYALNTGRTSESEPSVDGRVHVVYTGQVMAHTGDWLLADSAVAGHQIHSWLDSQAAMAWWPQLDKYPNIGDKLHVNLAIPIAGPGTSWPVDKVGHPQSILTHVDVRLVQLSLNIEASWRFGGKPVTNNPANTESYDGIRGFVQQVIHHHPPTIISLDSDDPGLGCALSAQRPALYVFPGAGLTTQGCGLFSLQGFSMLLGGAYTAQNPPNWWPMVRNLPKLDAVLLPDWSAANLLTLQFMTKLIESGVDGGRIIGELLLPPPIVATESTSELALAPPTGTHMGLTHSAWAPQGAASESLPASMVLYSKLGWGELRLQPLAQRAGLVLLWKSVSHHDNLSHPLRIVLPASQSSGTSPVQGLIRLLKSLSTVPQLEMKASGAAGSTVTKSSVKSVGAAPRTSTNHAATRLNGPTQAKPQAAQPRPQTASRPAMAKPTTTTATKKPMVSAPAPPKRPVTASVASTTAAAPKRPVSSTPATKEPAARPSKSATAAPPRPAPPNKLSSTRPATTGLKMPGTTANVASSTKPTPPKPKVPSTADRLAAHASLVASKQPTTKITTATGKPKTTTAPPSKKPAAPAVGKVSMKAKSPIREVPELSPTTPAIDEKPVAAVSVDESKAQDALRESLELAPADPLMSGWCSLEQSDVTTGAVTISSEQQQQQQPITAQSEVPYSHDFYKVHKFEGFNEADETDLMEGARTPSSVDQEPDDVVHDHTLEPQESAVPGHEYQEEDFYRVSDTQFVSPIGPGESKTIEDEPKAELEQISFSGAPERFDIVGQGDNEIAPPMHGDVAKYDQLVGMPTVPFSFTPEHLGHEAEEEENMEPEPEIQEFQLQKSLSPIHTAPEHPMFTQTEVPADIGTNREGENLTDSFPEHYKSEADSLEVHDFQPQEVNDLSDTGSFEQHEQAASTDEVNSNVVHDNMAFVAGELSSTAVPAGIDKQGYESTNNENPPTNQPEAGYSPIDRVNQLEPNKFDLTTEPKEEQDDHMAPAIRDQWYHSTGLLDDTTEDEQPSAHDEEQHEIPTKDHSDSIFQKATHSGFESDFPADDLLVHASSGLPVSHAPQPVIETQEQDQWEDRSTKEVVPGAQVSPILDQHDGTAEHAATDVQIISSQLEPERKPTDIEENMVPTHQAYSHTAPGPMGDVMVAEDEAFAVPTEFHKESEQEHFVHDDEQHPQSVDVEHHEAAGEFGSHVIHTDQTGTSSDVEADGVSTTVHQPWPYMSGQPVLEDDQSIEAQMRLKIQQEAAQRSAETESQHFSHEQEHHYRQQCEQSSDVSDAEMNDTEIVVIESRKVAQSFQPSVASPLSPTSANLSDSMSMSEDAHISMEQHIIENVGSSHVDESFPQEGTSIGHVVSSDLDVHTKLITGSIDSLEEAVNSSNNKHETADGELAADSTTVLDRAIPTSTIGHEQHDAQEPIQHGEMLPHQLEQHDSQAVADSTTAESPLLTRQHDQLPSIGTTTPAPIGFDRFITEYDQEGDKFGEHPVDVGSPDSQASMDSVVHHPIQEHPDMEHAAVHAEIDPHGAHITSTQPASDEAHGEAEALEYEDKGDVAQGLEAHGELGFRGYEHQTSTNGTAHDSIPPLPNRMGSEDNNQTNGLQAASHLPGSPSPGQFENGNAHQHEQYQHEADGGALSPADRLKMLQTGFTTDFEHGHPETTWSPSGETWPHKSAVRPEQFSPDSFGEDDGAHQEVPYPRHGVDFLAHATGTNPFETAGSPSAFGHPADAPARQTSHPGHSPLVSPQADGFDPSQGWGQPQGLPAPILPTTASRGARTTNIPSRPAPLSRPATASAAATREKPTSTINSKPAAPATLPPGPPIYMDLIWVPGYLTQVPHSMAVEFFARVRAHTYVLSGDALHPMIGEALIEAKAKWGPNDVELLCKHAGADTQNNAICILPTDEPYEWNCWLRTPCGRISRETGEARLEACGFKVLPSASCCDIEFSAGAVNVRCEGVRVEF